MDGHPNRVDPNKWRPLIFSFQQFYGLASQVHPSRLGEIPEGLYRTPDIDLARKSVEHAVRIGLGSVERARFQQ